MDDVVLGIGIGCIIIGIYGTIVLIYDMLHKK